MGKLPNDLAYQEFGDLVQALNVLTNSAGSSQQVNRATVVKVQYGSDFETILSVAVIALPSFLAFAKFLDTLAAAGLKNEDRLGKRAERLARGKEIEGIKRELGPEPQVERWTIEHRLESLDPGGPPRQSRRPPRRAKQSALDKLLPADARRALEQDGFAAGEQPPEVVAALVLLAEYGVRIRVQGSD